MAKGLGKGIGALFPSEDIHKSDSVQLIAISKIDTNPFQPRKTFDESALVELSHSIREHGIIQPVVLRVKGKKYEIVVGERRFRAAKMAGLSDIPAIVKELTEQEVMEIALLENLQREDLTPIEEAEAYQGLMVHLNYTQDQLAKRLGKSRPHIANLVRLLQLPAEVRTQINEGKLSMGQGRTLLGLKNKRRIPELAQKVIKDHINVRQLEALVQQYNIPVSRETNKAKKKDVFVRDTETHLREFFGTQVQISKTKKKGKIEIEFYGEDDLQRILDLLQIEIN